MEADSKKEPVLNTILFVLNIGLEILLAFILLGFLIGIWNYIS